MRNDAMSSDATAVFDHLQAVANPILILRENRILWANAAASALTGYSPDDLATMALVDLLAPAWRRQFADATPAGEVELATAQGERIWVEVWVNPSEIDGDAVEIVTLNDIRQRKQLEQSLNQRETIYRRAIEANLDGFYLLQCQYDSAGKPVDLVFADVNAPGEAIIPASKGQLIGQRLSSIFPHQKGLEFLKKYLAVAETGEPVDEDFELTRRNGDQRWFHHQVIAVKDGVAVFIRDITDRKSTEAALRESERRYRALLNQSNDCVSLLDLNGNYLLVNEQMASRLGYTPEEMVGKPLSQMIAPDEVPNYHEMDRALKSGEQVPLFERTYRSRDGSEFLGEVNITMVRDANGTPLYIQSIMRDVTWRRETEKALRESEERYRIISELISDYAYAFQVAPDGTLVHDWITNSFKRITGYDHEEIDERGQYALFHPDEAARTEADVKRVLQGEAMSGVYRIITKSGDVRWVNIFRQPVWDEAEQRVVRVYGVAQDITERKQSEDELRKSEEQYRLIAENATDIISRASIEGIYTYVSSACRALLGYTQEEMIGRSILSLIHPDDHAHVHDFFVLLEQGSEARTITCRIRRKDDDYGWFEITAQTIRDPNTNRAREFIAVSRDVSHRKEMERLQQDQERLRYELQKEQELNEVKSNLMRTISHEFRTPLALIVTATDLLDKYIEHLDLIRRKERLQAIRIQVKRLSDMLDDISFVVQGTLHHMSARPSRINLEMYCRSILEEIQLTVGRNHQFVFTTDGQLHEGIADKALIVRIMSNLLSNAVKYSPENSTITVMLYLRDGDAILEVSDQGIGIDPEEQMHIFEPFYRGASVLDTVGGTGLGLSIVKDCVDLHGGTISVESEPGKGTTFVVHLPQILPEGDDQDL